MQVAALFDGLLIAGRLSCLGRLSNKGGGLKDEGRLGRWRLEEEEREVEKIQAELITLCMNQTLQVKLGK